MSQFKDNPFVLHNPTPGSTPPTNDRNPSQSTQSYSNNKWLPEITPADKLSVVTKDSLPSIRVLHGRDNADLWLEDVQDVIYGLGIESFMAGEIPEPPEKHASRRSYRVAGSYEYLAFKPYGRRFAETAAVISWIPIDEAMGKGRGSEEIVPRDLLC